MLANNITRTPTIYCGKSVVEQKKNDHLDINFKSAVFNGFVTIEQEKFWIKCSSMRCVN